LAGQSNAQGYSGDAAFYPADPNGLDSQIRFNWTYIGNSSSSDWETMQAQDGRFPSGHFGPEVTFSRAQNAGYNPAIFKFINLVQVYIPIGKRLVTVVIMI
jgi:hypothetical protein